MSWVCHMTACENDDGEVDNSHMCLASCFQAALLNIGEYLPDLGVAIAHSGLHALISCHAKPPCRTVRTMASLFLTQASLSLAFRSLCLAAGMNYKGEHWTQFAYFWFCL